MHSLRLDRKQNLLTLASRQGGLFTAKQAAAMGYSPRLQHHHASAGNWRRLDRGIYRIANWPSDQNESLIFATLWTRGSGVISHESALAVYGLSDLMPGEVHITVPRGFRKRPVDGIVLHRGDLRPQDIDDHGAFRTTTPVRSLADAAVIAISPEHLRSAVADAVQKGLAQKRAILDAALDLPREASTRLRSAVKASEVLL